MKPQLQIPKRALVNNRISNHPSSPKTSPPSKTFAPLIPPQVPSPFRIRTSFFLPRHRIATLFVRRNELMLRHSLPCAWAPPNNIVAEARVSGALSTCVHLTLNTPIKECLSTILSFLRGMDKRESSPVSHRLGLRVWRSQRIVIVIVIIAAASEPQLWKVPKGELTTEHVYLETETFSQVQLSRETQSRPSKQHGQQATGWQKSCNAGTLFSSNVPTLRLITCFSLTAS